MSLFPKKVEYPFKLPEFLKKVQIHTYHIDKCLSNIVIAFFSPHHSSFFASAVVHTDGPVNRCAKSIKETIH